MPHPDPDAPSPCVSGTKKCRITKPYVTGTYTNTPVVFRHNCDTEIKKSQRNRPQPAAAKNEIRTDKGKFRHIP